MLFYFLDCNLKGICFLFLVDLVFLFAVYLMLFFVLLFFDRQFFILLLQGLQLNLQKLELSVRKSLVAQRGMVRYFLDSSAAALWASMSALNLTVALCSMESLDSKEATLAVYFLVEYGTPSGRCKSCKRNSPFPLITHLLCVLYQGIRKPFPLVLLADL